MLLLTSFASQAAAQDQVCLCHLKLAAAAAVSHLLFFNWPAQCCWQLLLLLLTMCMLLMMRLARGSALLAHSHSANMGSSMRPDGSFPCMFATCRKHNNVINQHTTEHTCRVLPTVSEQDGSCTPKHMPKAVAVTHVFEVWLCLNHARV